MSDDDIKIMDKEEEYIEDFKNITNSNESVARAYLKRNNGDLNAAVNDYLLEKEEYSKKEKKKKGIEGIHDMSKDKDRHDKLNSFDTGIIKK
jgi:hypothetical protein